MKRCILCKRSYEGFGNNAEPLAKGRCCDNCNIKVILERLKDVPIQMKGGIIK